MHRRENSEPSTLLLVTTMGSALLCSCSQEQSAGRLLHPPVLFFCSLSQSLVVMMLVDFSNTRPLPSASQYLLILI